MPTIVLIAAAGILYALFEIFFSRAAGKINDYLANVIVNGIGLILPLLVFIALRNREGSTATSRTGLVFSILAGLSIAGFTVLLIKVFARGGNLAYVIPLIYGGALVISALSGWFIFKQSSSILEVSGVIIVTIGIVCIVAAKA